MNTDKDGLCTVKATEFAERCVTFIAGYVGIEPAPLAAEDRIKHFASEIASSRSVSTLAHLVACTRHADGQSNRCLVVAHLDWRALIDASTKAGTSLKFFFRNELDDPNAYINALADRCREPPKKSYARIYYALGELYLEQLVALGPLPEGATETEHRTRQLLAVHLVLDLVEQRLWPKYERDTVVGTTKKPGPIVTLADPAMREALRDVLTSDSMWSLEVQALAGPQPPPRASPFGHMLPPNCLH